jgi:hypothetical protein
MAVFVTAAPVVDVKKVDKETETRLAAAIKDAKTKRADLEKSLKAQHGKSARTGPRRRRTPTPRPTRPWCWPRPTTPIAR